MKKLLIAITVAIMACLGGCDMGDGYDGRNAVISSSNDVLLEDVIFYVSPYLMDGDTKRYIVTEKLENLILKISDVARAPADSYALNTSAVADVVEVDGFRTTTQIMRYPFKINVEISMGGFTTAGEYALLLRNRLNLTPGSYLCQITSFEFQKTDQPGEPHKVESPILWTTLDVEEGRASISLGEFEVNIR